MYCPIVFLIFTENVLNMAVRNILKTRQAIALLTAAETVVSLRAVRNMLEARSISAGSMAAARCHPTEVHEFWALLAKPLLRPSNTDK